VGAFPAQSNMLSAAELGLIEALPQPILCCQIDGTVLHANPAARQLLDTDPMALQSALFAVLANKGIPPQQRFEWSLMLPDSATLHLEVSPALLTDETHPRFLLLTLHDLSAQKRAEIAEQEQRALAHALRDTAAELTRSLDLESVLKAILDNVGRVVPHDTANILLIEGAAARCALQRGYPPDSAQFLLTYLFPLGLANFEHMIKTGESYLVSDVRSDDRWYAYESFNWIRSYIAVPIRAYDRVIGFLNLESHQPSAFTSIHAERLRIFSDQAAIAIENAQLYEAMYHDASELRALNRATAFLFTLSPRTAGQVSEVAERIAKMIVDEFDAVDCGVLLLNETTNTLEIVAHAGDLLTSYLTHELQSGQGLIGAALRDNQTIYAPNVDLDPRYVAGAPYICSELVVPLRTVNGLIGVIDLQSEAENAFSLEDRYLMEAFAPFAAAAIDNVRLYQCIQEHTENLEAKVEERTAEVQRTRYRVEAILNHSSDAILLAYPNGAIQQANYAFGRMFGYSSEEVHGLPFTACADLPYSAALTAAVNEVVERAQPGRIEIVARRHSGETFDADVTLSPLSTQGQVTNLVCSLRDISHLKQLERDLREALMKERTLNEVRSRLITRVSHEFRTPLAMIKTASEMLQRYHSRMTSEQRDEKLERINEGVDRITTMLNNLLSSSDPKAGHNTFAPVMLNLETLCREQIVRACEEDRNQHPVAFSIQGNCTWVMLDPELTARIISHLLSNAAKYSSPGSPIEFSLSCQLANTIIRIQDHGIGIPSEDYPHLFEPFHRARNVQDFDGAGLGLAVVRRAVEMQGGTITFESQLGKGSLFTVTIPGNSEREAK
jgi:PAS domain S-box-containing protein